MRPSRRKQARRPPRAESGKPAAAPQPLLFATGNAGKVAELRGLCDGLPLQVETLADWASREGQAVPEVVEDGETFLDNALKKAAAAARATGVTVLADDSGLEVDALDGRPGVYSARFAAVQAGAGEVGDNSGDGDNNSALLAALADVEDADRRARFRCTLVLCGPLAAGPGCRTTEDGLPWRAFVGTAEGTIERQASGGGGFGYDPLFRSLELGRTFADATREEKAAVSHRGRAFRGLIATLRAGQAASEARERPLYLRRVGLEALAMSLDKTLQGGLRHADRALDATFERHRALGSKERAAVAHLHWHALRRLGLFALARAALQGGPPPDAAPDPRELNARDAALLALFALADVDAVGEPIEPNQPAGVRPPSALDGLLHRNGDLKRGIPESPERLVTALRAAARVAETLPATDRIGVTLGYHPALVDAVNATLGPEPTERALEYMNHRGPLTVRANRLIAGRQTLHRTLSRDGLAAIAAPGADDALILLRGARLTALPAYRDGRFEVQDAGSQRLAELVGARPGEHVADWCAGAGGKTLALGVAMEGRGRLWALDVHERRLDECRRRVRRSGLQNVTIQRHDDCGEEHELPPMDRVLVDAPCTGSGALRRNPEMRWHVDEAWLERFPAQQLAILEAAAMSVRAGGRLVYATCSLLRIENEDVVQAFLERHPGWTLVHDERIGPGDAAALERGQLPAIGPDGFYGAVLRAPEGEA